MELDRVTIHPRRSAKARSLLREFFRPPFRIGIDRVLRVNFSTRHFGWQASSDSRFVQITGKRIMAELVAVGVKTLPQGVCLPGNAEVKKVEESQRLEVTVTEPPPVAASGPDRMDRLLAALKNLRWQLAILSILAVLATLYVAQAVFVPIALSIVLSLLLRPPVRWMYRRHIPETVGAIVCLLFLVVVLAAVVVPLLGPAQTWTEQLPQHLEQVVEKLKGLKDRFSQLLKVRSQIAEFAASGEPDENAPVAVTLQEPDLTSGAGVLSSTGNMLGMWLIIIVLTFFLLIAGDQLINNVLMILPTFREKRQTVEMIKELERGVSAYLLTVTMINVGLGIVVTVVLWLMGVPNAPVWGLMTTVFNYVPFIGQGVAGLVIGLVALLSFDSIGYALLVPVVFYSIAAVEGNVITPALLGRRMSLNPIMVLLFLIGWGWMWGIAGAFLAVPILAIIKLGCDRFESTRPVGTLLGG